MLWEAILSKQVTKDINGFGGGCLGHLKDLWPLGVGVNNQEIHPVLKWSSKINVYSLPGFRWPSPGL